MVHILEWLSGGSGKSELRRVGGGDGIIGRRRSFKIDAAPLTGVGRACVR